MKKKNGYLILFLQEKRKIIDHCERMRATIRPYRPSASAKIKIKIIPTKILSCCAFALTPASPTIPMASPAASELSPQQSPAERCA